MSRPEGPPSDELLNAFIDGELSVEERECLLEKLSRDGELSHRVCELQKVRDMVQLAYDMVPGQEQCVAQAAHRSGRFGRAAAAMLLVAGGLSLGWMANGHFNPPPGNGLLAIADSVQKNDARPSRDGGWRVVLHLSTDDPQKLDQSLREAQDLLAAHKRQRSELQVEVVANAGGLNLLRADTSPNPKLVEQLQARYQNISFLACRQALERLKQEQGLEPELLPGTRIVPSAVAQIIERQGEGWTYIRI